MSKTTVNVNGWAGLNVTAFVGKKTRVPLVCYTDIFTLNYKKICILFIIKLHFYTNRSWAGLPSSLITAGIRLFHWSIAGHVLSCDKMHLRTECRQLSQTHSLSNCNKYSGLLCHKMPSHEPQTSRNDGWSRSLIQKQSEATFIPIADVIML
jgi:hypothetical protein